MYTPKEVGEQEFVDKLMIKTTLASGREIKLFPAPMDTNYLAEHNNEMAAPPRLGEHNKSVLTEAGLTENEINELKEENLI